MGLGRKALRLAEITLRLAGMGETGWHGTETCKETIKLVKPGPEAGCEGHVTRL